ncbi:hypothetical protein [Methyloversatilis sp.]|uniref:hypothetical protein n=1 Tax=Methyloversatilis sp. TaxID=2569862 RepID=UPI0035B4C597
MWSRARNAVARRGWLAFVLMGICFFLFSLNSYNLFFIARANIDLWLEHGPSVWREGAALQVGELIFSGYLSLFFYTGFKLCEHLLVARLSGETPEHDQGSK